jgi:hypothetical protein
MSPWSRQAGRASHLLADVAALTAGSGLVVAARMDETRSRSSTGR